MMKPRSNIRIVLVGLITLAAFVTPQDIQCADNDLTSSKAGVTSESDFDMIGTVTKREADSCMAGINYDLHSGDEDKNVIGLKASLASDKELLEQASKTSGRLHVKGTVKNGVEVNCKWIDVSSVTPAEKSHSFTGKSKSGNLTEALRDAINQAKDSLHTDFVTWKIEKITGSNGGFTQVNEISVTITASPP